jgi:hypothetical protein
VLEGVVEDEAICAESLQGHPAREEAVRTGQDGDPRQVPGQEDRLVSRLPSRMRTVLPSETMFTVARERPP